MGKRIIQQKRGRGNSRYRSPGFRFKGASKMLHKNSYRVTKLSQSPAHSAPIMHVEYDDGTKGVCVAPEGIIEGESYDIDSEDVERGNVAKLGDLPEGTSVSNVEGKPGDGGKYMRSSGSSGRIVAKTDDYVTVKLPSKFEKQFNPNCRAMIGMIAGSGRTEKPFLKAGHKHYAMKARNKLYPITSGGSMNAVSHPFGNSRSLRKAKAKPAPKNAPPGRKVGSIRPKQQGRKR